MAAVKVVVCPEHIVPELAEIATVGVGLTIKLTLAVLTQPFISVPVTT